MSVQCMRLREGQLTDYLEGALTPAEVDAVEFHLVTCAPCADMLHGHRQVSSMLRLLGPR
jgi:anti-sigma factor RsiW